MSDNRPLVLHIFTVSESLVFLKGQIGYMQQKNFRVATVSSDGSYRREFENNEQARTFAISIPRRISPISDIVAVFRIWRLCLRLKPAIVHGHTPKGGLLGMIAATLARVPARIYHVRGLPIITAYGFSRILLWATEFTSCTLAHRIFCVSPSLRQTLLNERICHPQKVKILANGSGNGVDSAYRFNPEMISESKQAIRSSLGIVDSAFVLGYVGRLAKDKGVVELLEAWKKISLQYPQARLLMVGPIESRAPIPKETYQQLTNDPTIILAGAQRDTAPFYKSMDVLCLPTHREGFPNVVLEGSSMQIPVITTDAVGARDSVKNNKTGVIVRSKSVEDLVAAITFYIENENTRLEHGLYGRNWIKHNFQPEKIWESLAEEYKDIIDRMHQR